MTRQDFSYRLKLRDELRRAVATLSANPSTSVSISAGGGTKSVSYAQLSSIAEELRKVESEIREYKRSILGGGAFDAEYARWC